MTTFVNTSFIVYNTNIVNKFSDFNTSSCNFVNTSIVNYASSKNLTPLTTMDNYYLSLTIYASNKCNDYNVYIFVNVSSVTFINNCNASLSYYATN